jgi:hypothetical protein
VLGNGRRLIIRAGDLLDHDAALALELRGVDQRATGDVCQEVDRCRRRLGADRDVERDEVVARVGVEDRSQTLGGAVHIAVVAVALTPFEHEVFEEMRDAVLRLALGTRAGVEGDQCRQRARPRNRDPVDREAVWSRRCRDARQSHKAIAPLGRRPVTARRRRQLPGGV